MKEIARRGILKKAFHDGRWRSGRQQLEERNDAIETLLGPQERLKTEMGCQMLEYILQFREGDNSVSVSCLRADPRRKG
jgi:hypothetical protein